MSVKYHFNPESGEPGRCSATKQSCRYAKNGEVPEHYDSEEEARAAYEKTMNSASFATFNRDLDEEVVVLEGQQELLNDKLKPAISNRKPRKTAAAKPKEKLMGMRELNNEAKFTTDEKIQVDAAVRGSERVQESLMNNPNLTTAGVVALRDNAKTISLVNRARKHWKYPVENLSPAEFTESLTKQNAPYRLNSDAITDDHVSNMLENYSESTNAYDSRYNAALQMISNPNNKVSPEMVKKVADEKAIGQYDYNTYVIPSGKFDTYDYIKDKSIDDVSQLDFARSDDPKTLDSVTRYVTEKKDNDYDDERDNYRMRFVLRNLANNPNNSTENLQKMYDSYSNTEAGKDGFVTEALASNPNTPKPIKDFILNSDPIIRDKANANRILKINPNIREDLTKEKSVSRLNNSGTYSRETIQLDRDKIKEMGLSDGEISSIFGRGYNAKAKYDSETGIFIGEIDSSD